MPMPMCPISLVGEHAHILFRDICLGVLWADWVRKPMYQARLPMSWPYIIHACIPICYIGWSGKHTHVLGKHAYCSY